MIYRLIDHLLRFFRVQRPEKLYKKPTTTSPFSSNSLIVCRGALVLEGAPKVGTEEEDWGDQFAGARLSPMRHGVQSTNGGTSLQSHNIKLSRLFASHPRKRSAQAATQCLPAHNCCSTKDSIDAPKFSNYRHLHSHLLPALLKPHRCPLGALVSATPNQSLLLWCTTM